jgi:hypothetical protein
LVGYRDDAVYLRASSEEAGRDILRMLNEKWLGFRALQKASPPQPLQREEKPAVHIAMSICFDDNYRAIAKIAFNLLAAKMGAAFVLRDEFDPIRNYIRGIGLVHRAPLSDEEVAVDTRFVHAVPGDEKALIPTSTHAVLITYIPPDLVGIVTLYKKTSFIVRLAVIHLEEQLLEAHEFSIDRTSNKMLEISELARRLLGYEPADPTPATRSSPLASDRPYHPTRRPRDHEEP